MTARSGQQVFLLVSNNAERGTSEQYASMHLFDEIFGPGAADHTIIAFTHIAELNRQEMTIEEFLESAQDGPADPLNKLLNRFYQRYFGDE
ncbi:unnamed protein product [Rotaria magnacalcarata]|uniref:AIG1-type G domain-containing protein n=1 Tax=Rotaria magnacalcarata TaxID=392030 RepID=A0A815CDR4_9BILA|nr:unnamed protein product [Rotaria magnacalcarata]CAF4518086.1 unnamed protein product [Rotaria magnacalcarata]CAF4559971.1 unnamed protein product [Rotaria magnacalcarata]